MANQEHVAILRQGVEVWNQWIKGHFGVLPDFSTPYMVSPGFGKVSEPDTEIARAGLSGMNLSGVNLGGANLSGTNLNRVNLSHANLTGARLTYADLQEANFIQAELTGVDFTGSDLAGANLTEAIIGGTIFANVDLSTVKGLDTLTHWGPSTIGIDTLSRLNAAIPEIFLRGVGFTETQISSLMPHPIEYASLFISYAHQDEALAKQLYDDLNKNAVKCWLALEDMKIGDKLRFRIDESIHLHDKFLLILSEHSVTSQWVEYEVETALSKERERGSSVLFPIRVDNTVLESTTGWASYIRLTRHIGNFTNWRDDVTYKQAFSKLLQDLKVDRLPTL